MDEPIQSKQYAARDDLTRGVRINNMTGMGEVHEIYSRSFEIDLWLVALWALAALVIAAGFVLWIWSRRKPPK